jgi:hypothetical protein
MYLVVLVKLCGPAGKYTNNKAYSRRKPSYRYAIHHVLYIK